MCAPVLVEFLTYFVKPGSGVASMVADRVVKPLEAKGSELFGDFK